jgi:PST family polysaccharide transporter
MSILFEDNRAQSGHGRKSLHGGAVSIASRAVSALVQVGSVIFLARLLTPEDYGLVAMVTAITGLAPLVVDLGTRDALLQRPTITRGEVSALFWISMAVGSLFAALVAGSGPIIARIYHEPRLTEIALISSTAAITSALAAQHSALMRRAMLFKRLAIIETVAGALGAATVVTIAARGGGYWALVLRPIITTGMVAIGAWTACRWLPTKPDFTAGVRTMLKFGIHLTGFTVTDFTGRSMDRVAIGLRSGAQHLGYYQKAMLLYDNLLDVLTVPLHSVASASLSKLTENLAELKRAWGKALEALAFFAMPAFGIIAVIGRDLIAILLGEKWSYAGVLLGVLAMRGIPHVLERTHGWLHVAAGRADRWMRYGVSAVIVQAVALLFGLPYGAMGIAVAYTISMYLLCVPAVAYAGQPLGIGVSDVLKAVGRQMVAAVAAALIVAVVRDHLLVGTPQMIRLALTGLLYAAFYLVIAAGIFKVTAPLRLAWSLVEDVFRLKRTPRPVPAAFVEKPRPIDEPV